MTINQDVINTIFIILGQTLGLAAGYFLSRWVRGTDEDEELDNEEI